MKRGKSARRVGLGNNTNVSNRQLAADKFVELELAANFSAASFRILSFDDLKVDFEDHTYLFECKRPSHSGTLDQNVEKAYTQLRAKLDHSSDRGIVAIAVEKVFGLDSRIQRVESGIAANDFAIQIAKALYRKVSKYERTWVDPRVVGILAIIRFLMKSKADAEVIASSYVLVLLKFDSGQKEESKRLDRLVSTLRSGFLQV